MLNTVYSVISVPLYGLEDFIIPVWIVAAAKGVAIEQFSEEQMGHIAKLAGKRVMEERD